MTKNTAEEKMYALVLFGDGDARVYQRGEWEGKDTLQGFTYSVVQTSPDKQLLIKMANLARGGYIDRFRRLNDEQFQAVCESVDQTGERDGRKIV